MQTPIRLVQPVSIEATAKQPRGDVRRGLGGRPAAAPKKKGAGLASRIKFAASSGIRLGGRRGDDDN